jgi:hypothetical protein
MPQLNLTMPSRNRSCKSRPEQTGAATLIVVMILFFVVTLAAAYAGRNLIFEQRTANNQYRSTGAQEAAEAGIEWALTMLNAGRIDEFCAPTTDVTVAGNKNFRQRYLTYDADGMLDRQAFPVGSTETNAWAGCSANNGGAWTCVCAQPGGTTAALASLPTGSAAFAVRFSSLGLGRPGTIRIEVNGCSSTNMDCLTSVQPVADLAACQSTSCALLAQYTSVRQPPTAAITAAGNVTGSLLQAYNSDLNARGITIHSGGTITVSTLQLGSTAGTPPSLSTRPGDTALTSLDAHADDCNLCLFSAVFGLKPATYREQQGVVKVDCGTTGCTSTSSTSALGEALNSLRGSSWAFDADLPGYFRSPPVLWLTGAGGLRLSSSSDSLGSLLAPVTIIVEGPLAITGGSKIFGLVFAGSAVINDGDATVGSIQGALVSAGGVSANGAAGTYGKVSYNAAILDKLQKFSGTFVRVPGSWRDFP